MWLYTQHGHASVVRSKEGRMLVRTRSSKDLARILEVANLHVRVDHTPDADYAWRAFLTRRQLRRLMRALADDVKYSNFKSRAQQTLGQRYASLLSNIWWDCVDTYGTGRYARSKYGKHGAL